MLFFILQICLKTKVHITNMIILRAGVYNEEIKNDIRNNINNTAVFI